MYLALEYLLVAFLATWVVFGSALGRWDFIPPLPLRMFSAALPIACVYVVPSQWSYYFLLIATLAIAMISMTGGAFAGFSQRIEANTPALESISSPVRDVGISVLISVGAGLSLGAIETQSLRSFVAGAVIPVLDAQVVEGRSIKIDPVNIACEIAPLGWRSFVRVIAHESGTYTLILPVRCSRDTAYSTYFSRERSWTASRDVPFPATR